MELVHDLLQLCRDLDHGGTLGSGIESAAESKRQKFTNLTRISGGFQNYFVADLVLSVCSDQEAHPIHEIGTRLQAVGRLPATSSSNTTPKLYTSPLVVAFHVWLYSGAT
jgi:hypothetical protein